MKWWGWVLSLLPIGAGVVILGLAATEIIENPVVYLRSDLVNLSLRGGLAITLIAIGAGLRWAQIQRNHAKEVHNVNMQANNERKRFLSRLDHELKNPLTAIRTGLSNIAYLSTDQDLQEEVSAVNGQVLRISRLVSDLRKLASIENTPIEKTNVDLSVLLEDIVAVVRDQPNYQGQEISLTLPRAPWPLTDVQGDPDLLTLVILNLLDNAVKFSCPEDTIEIRASEDGRDVVIEVADTGPGIPQEEIEHVWEELYRGEQARGVPGSGLGLTLVRAIVDRHGGSVRLQSRPKQGTVFSLRLPIE